MKRRTIPWGITLFFLVLFSCDKDEPDPEEPCYLDCNTIDYGAIDTQASWSPDGKWIAFTHSDSIAAKTGIWLIRPDGTGARLWQMGLSSYLTWSPDGQWIAFEYRHQIWKRKMNGDSLTQLTSEGRNYFPSWSPDGKQLAFDSNSQSAFYAIMTMNIDGSNKSLIDYDPTDGGSRIPHWGKTNQIVHTRYPLGNMSEDIYIMDADGENLKRLTADDKTDRWSKLSPDGSQIVYTSQDHNKEGDPRPSLFSIDASGKNMKMLARPGIDADWSPDGKTIVYTLSSSSNGRLWLMAPDGSNQRQLTFKNQF